MKIPTETAITLVHELSSGSIATQSTQLPGYPYASTVPCVVDEGHRPLFFVSALAEHTRNLLADPRASLSLIRAETANVQAAARITLIGDAERLTDPCPELVARYLRYHPDAEEYLALDFMFFRLAPRLARYIGGVGKMGWIDATEWAAIPALPLADEAALVRQATIEAPRGIRLLGIDCFGIDYEIDGRRARQRFPEAPLAPEKLEKVVLRMVAMLN